MHCPLSMQEFFGIGSKISSTSLKLPAGKVEVDIGERKLFTVACMKVEVNIGERKLFTVVVMKSFDFFIRAKKS